MKQFVFGVALMSWVLPGCGGDSGATIVDRKTVNSAVEIQVAVRDTPRKEGLGIEEGNWHVAASCVVPVYSNGGPGTGIASMDGATISVRWNDVHISDKGDAIVFDGFQWSLANPIHRRDGVSHTMGDFSLGEQAAEDANAHRRMRLSDRFDHWLGSCELDTCNDVESDRMLVIRCRWHPKSPDVQPINLADTVDVAAIR